MSLLDEACQWFWSSLLVPRITYFFIENVSTWVGTEFVLLRIFPSPERSGSKPYDSGITLHDDLNGIHFVSYELQAKRTWTVATCERVISAD